MNGKCPGCQALPSDGSQKDFACGSFFAMDDGGRRALVRDVGCYCSEINLLRKSLAQKSAEAKYFQKLADENLEKTADGKFVVECEQLHCPKCGGVVRKEYDLCYCDECGNPDDGCWPHHPPLPLCYESTTSKPMAKGGQ